MKTLDFTQKSSKQSVHSCPNAKDQENQQLRSERINSFKVSSKNGQTGEILPLTHVNLQLYSSIHSEILLEISDIYYAKTVKSPALLPPNKLSQVDAANRAGSSVLNTSQRKHQESRRYYHQKIRRQTATIENKNGNISRSLQPNR